MYLYYSRRKASSFIYFIIYLFPGQDFTLLTVEQLPPCIFTGQFISAITKHFVFNEGLLIHHNIYIQSSV